MKRKNGSRAAGTMGGPDAGMRLICTNIRTRASGSGHPQRQLRYLRWGTLSLAQAPAYSSSSSSAGAAGAGRPLAELVEGCHLLLDSTSRDHQAQAQLRIIIVHVLEQGRVADLGHLVLVLLVVALQKLLQSRTVFTAVEAGDAVTLPDAALGSHIVVSVEMN